MRMMKKAKKMTVLLLTMSMLLTALVGCGDSPGKKSDDGQETGNTGNSTANAEGFPISEETIDLEFFRINFPGAFENCGEMWKWKDYAEKTNINVEWTEEPLASYMDKLNIQLTTGKLPDVYYQMVISNSMVYENGKNGNFIALNDLIDNYAPNIKKLLEENPAVKAAVTMPDGNIYALPWVSQNVLERSTRTYINEALVEELGVKFPTTIDELTTFMRAMKEKYPDSYPMAMPEGGIGVIMNTFYGAWGIGNTGQQGINMNIDLDTDGNVRFFRASEEYKEMLKQFAEWYDEGLIHPEMFTTMDASKWMNLGAQNQVGVFCWVNPSYIGNADVFTNFKGISQFQGIVDHPVMTYLDSEVRSGSAFMITKENEYPVETIKWADYWYGDEGASYKIYGQEGVTYAKGEDGIYGYIGEAETAYEEGTLHNALGHYGGFEPGIEGTAKLTEFAQQWIDPNDETRSNEYIYQVDDLDEYLEYLPATVWSAFVGTEEEEDEINKIYTDLGTYVNEMMPKFITGETDLDDGWDAYLQTLQELDVDRYVEIRQAQYERISE